MAEARSILFALSRYYPGGDAAARLLRLLALGLRKAGFDVRIIAATKEPSETGEWRVDGDGFPLKLAAGQRRGRIGRFTSYLALPRNIARAVAQEVGARPVTAVVTYGQSYRLLAPIVHTCRRFDVPVVSFVTEQWSFAADLAVIATDNWLFRKVLQKKLSGVLAISHWLLEDARRCGIPALRLPALGDVVAPAASRPSALKDSFDLVYVGPLFRRDLPGTLIEGFHETLRRGKNGNLTIVGRTNSTPSGRAFAEKVAAHKELRERVSITGWVSDDELARLMEKADAFVILRDDDIMSRACFPFRLSGFLLTGKPVILSAVGEVSRLFKHGENAWLIPPGHSVKELADAVEALATNPALAAEIGASGRKTAIAEMGYEENAARAASFLSGLSSSRQSSAS